jgi:hypothetical protein
LVVSSLLFLFLSKFFPHAQPRRYFSTNEKGVDVIDYLHEVDIFIRVLMTFSGILIVLGCILMGFNVLTYLYRCFSSGNRQK